MNALNASEVTALLGPVLTLPLDLIADHDPELAERIRDATRALEIAVAEERQAGALASARRLFTLLMAAWGRGLLEHDELVGLVDLLSRLAVELQPRYAANRRGG